MNRITVIGLSHTNAMRAVMKTADAALVARFDFIHMLVAAPDRVFLVREGGATRLSPVLRERLAGAGEGIVVSQMGGNVHYFMGLFRHPQPYDFASPERPEMALDAGAQVLTYGYMAEAMRAQLADDFLALDALRAQCRGPLYHLESPPPVGDNRYCQDNLPPAFHKQAALGMQVASPGFRWRLWRLHSAMLMEHCAALGVAFVPCPAASMDQEGFLMQPYYSDPLHGNRAYGELLIAQLTEIAGEVSP